MAGSTLIIGGPAGYTDVLRAARLGMNVTVVERTGLGGVCMRHGCIPVKTFLTSERVYDTIKRADDNDDT